MTNKMVRTSDDIAAKKGSFLVCNKQSYGLRSEILLLFVVSGR